MLSLCNITNAAQAASYFSKDDYYLDREQREPSAWWGRGAMYLGLNGEVDRTAFFKLLSGELPNGQKLPHGRPLAGHDAGARLLSQEARAAEGPKQDGRPTPDARPPAGQKDGAKAAEAQGKSKGRRVGLDLTFSAPKSVSLMALVGGDARVAEAHGRAVEAALTYLEENTAYARKTVAGQTSFEKTSNFTVARFHHDTSRQLDPQMHTHCVVLNMTQRRDSSWRALSNEEVYRAKMVGGAIYRAELAHSLRSLGYSIARKHADGCFELAGFKDAEIKAFSQRRQEIKAMLEKSHVPDAKAAARATLLTRKAKREVDRTRLGEVWRSQAIEVGIDFERVRQARSLEPEPRAVTAEQSLHYAVSHLTERNVSFSTYDVLRHALGHGMGLTGYRAVARAIQLETGLGNLVVVQGTRERRFTTQAMIELEKQLVQQIERGKGELSPLLANASVGEAPGTEPGLTLGQRRALDMVVTSRDRIVGVQGYAGTGKTTMLRALKERAEAGGYQLRGLAPSAAAAAVLQEQAGIVSGTLARHLHGLHQAPAAEKPELWVVDELSMVCNRDALALLQAAHRAHARVVLLGDRNQLPSIESGKVFDLLMDRGMTTATMLQVVRQKNPLLKKAVLDTIQRDPVKSLASISVVEVDTTGERLQALAASYLNLSPEERRDTLVLTSAHSHRCLISDHIRQGLCSEGKIASRQYGAHVLVKNDLTRAQTRESIHYEPGLVIRFGRAYKNLGVSKGETLTVVSVDVPSNTVKLRGPKSRPDLVAWQPHRADKVEVYESEPRDLAVGDVIRWTRNDAGADRRNGHHATVVALNANEGETLATVRYQGRDQILSLTKAGHWDHGYVSTVHGAQGATARRAILHIDTRLEPITGYESWYVGLSRAKNAIQVFTDNAKSLPKVIMRSLGKDSALQLLEGNHNAEVARLKRGIEAPPAAVPTTLRFALRNRNTEPSV